MTTTHISLTNLSKLTGRHVAYLSRLVKEGTLPVGYKIGTARFVPKDKALFILSKVGRRDRNTEVKLTTIDDLLA